jgi:hypothetical protein
VAAKPVARRREILVCSVSIFYTAVAAPRAAAKNIVNEDGSGNRSKNGRKPARIAGGWHRTDRVLRRRTPRQRTTKVSNGLSRRNQVSEIFAKFLQSRSGDRRAAKKMMLHQRAKSVGIGVAMSGASRFCGT